MYVPKEYESQNQVSCIICKWAGQSKKWLSKRNTRIRFVGVHCVLCLTTKARWVQQVKKEVTHVHVNVHACCQHVVSPIYVTKWPTRTHKLLLWVLLIEKLYNSYLSKAASCTCAYEICWLPCMAYRDIFLGSFTLSLLTGWMVGKYMVLLTHNPSISPK